MTRNKSSMLVSIMEESFKELKEAGEFLYLYSCVQGREYVEHNLFITLLGTTAITTAGHGLISGLFYESNPELAIGFTTIPILTNVGAYLYEVGEDIYQSAKNRQAFRYWDKE